MNELSKNYQLKEKGKPVIEDGAKSAAALLEAKRVEQLHESQEQVLSPAQRNASACDKASTSRKIIKLQLQLLTDIPNLLVRIKSEMRI